MSERSEHRTRDSGSVRGGEAGGNAVTEPAS